MSAPDDCQTLTPADATSLTLTPLESALNDQWRGKDITMPPLPWEESKARAKARIAAFATSNGAGADVPEELDHWIAAFPAEWMVKFVLAVRTCGLLSVACRRARVSPYVLEKCKAACPEFAEAIKRAQDSAIDTVEGSHFVSATTGDPEPVFNKDQHVGWKRRKSEKAGEIILRAERPNKYRPDQIGVPVASVVLPSAEAVMEALKRLNAARPASETPAITEPNHEP